MPDLLAPLTPFLLMMLFFAGCTRPGKTHHASEVVTPEPFTFFVATNGNDQWSGKLDFPDRKGTDGPFATLPRALEALRKARRGQEALTRRPVIFARGGIHFLSEPLVIK